MQNALNEVSELKSQLTEARTELRLVKKEREEYLTSKVELTLQNKSVQVNLFNLSFIERARSIPKAHRGYGTAQGAITIIKSIYGSRPAVKISEIVSFDVWRKIKSSSYY